MNITQQTMPSTEIQRMIHSSYGEELVITSDDELDRLSNKSCPAINITDVIDVAAGNGTKKSIRIDLEVIYVLLITLELDIFWPNRYNALYKLTFDTVLWLIIHIDRKGTYTLHLNTKHLIMHNIKAEL